LNLGNTFSGIYTGTRTTIGVKRDDALGFDWKVVSLKAWLYSEADMEFLINLAQTNFGLHASGCLDGGVDASAFGLHAGVNASAYYSVSGGYDPTDGWHVDGSTALGVEVKLGVKTDCNSIIWAGPVPIGAHLCAGVGLKLGYKKGFYCQYLGLYNSGNDCQN
jgi:hypothetical protein